MPQIPVKNCCGCTACYNVCPQQAIRMEPDMEGFSYPKINLSLCISCGLCEKVCPVLDSPLVPTVYEDCLVAQSTSEEVLNSSTSGGFIDALYDFILNEKHGYAAGVLFGTEFVPKHIVTDSYETAKKFRNSKYAQSDLGTVFREIQDILNKKCEVLFVGTPCQVAGLKTFLRTDYDNLLTVDLVCRSVPSPKLWREYLKWQEQKHESRIVKISCRKKTYGYHSGTLEIQFENGACYRGSNRVDYYMKSFHHDICSRPSCYHCGFKTKHRCSDFTVFDSWNPQAVALEPLMDNDRGYSNVIVHTPKGKEIVRKIRNIKLYQANPENIFRFAGGMECASIRFKEERALFYHDLANLGFSKTVRKHVSVKWLDHMIEAMKPIRYAFKSINKK